MRGIQENKAHTVLQKQLQAYSSEMKAVISQVTCKFTELLKKNRMLGVEVLFRFPSKDIKDQILSNYEMNNALALGGNKKKVDYHPVQDI